MGLVIDLLLPLFFEIIFGQKPPKQDLFLGKAPQNKTSVKGFFEVWFQTTS